MMRKPGLLICVMALVMTSSAGARAAENAANPCAGRPATYQPFEGTCLPDRLVAYLKCMEKTGGGRISVNKEETSKNGTDLVVSAEGQGSGVIIKGSGKAGLSRKKVDESIRKLAEVYGDHTGPCLIAAGLKPSGKADPKAPGNRTSPKGGATPPAAPGIHQELTVGEVKASDHSTIRGGTIENGSARNVDQKIDVKGRVEAKGGSTVDLGNIKQ